MAPIKRRPRKRVLSDPELAAVLKTAPEGTDVFSHIVALLVLTGQRRGETTALQKSWCNRSDRLITLPDYVTKNYQEHTFPYGDLVESVLVRLSNIEGNLYFPAYRAHVRGVPTTTYNGWSKDKIEFDERCGVSNWTLHDLRRTFATRLAEAGVLPHILERLLNHRMGSISNRTYGIISQVAEVYNLATYLPEMRNAIALWENKLTALLRLLEAA
jgi:integrase